MKKCPNNTLAILGRWKQLSGQTFTLFDLMKELDADLLITISHFIDKQIAFLENGLFLFSIELRWKICDFPKFQSSPPNILASYEDDTFSHVCKTLPVRGRPFRN